MVYLCDCHLRRVSCIGPTVCLPPHPAGYVQTDSTYGNVQYGCACLRMLLQPTDKCVSDMHGHVFTPIGPQLPVQDIAILH